MSINTFENLIRAYGFHCETVNGMFTIVDNISKKAIFLDFPEGRTVDLIDLIGSLLVKLSME